MVPVMPDDPSSQSHLSAQDLSVWRGGRLIFKGLSFDLESGQSLVVTGPNGSGKSTLLRILAGLLRPETGSVSTHPAGEAFARYSGHKNGLKGALTVYENLRFWADLYGASRAQTTKVLDTLDLHKVAHMPTDILSAGWKRRVGLGRMALGDAPLWILDEPYTSLDSENIARLDNLLAAHANNGGLIVLATHQSTGFTPTQRIDMTDFQPESVRLREADW